ncbi:hypothetical protein [Herbaspirillum sp.]|uniref:hypothetical protein n=1 Tax=Herbaspirillum sp. TaxID=1890675 RepID=UPI000C1214E1|nr:hypothetical protein [Herbaspirillum sp.]MBO13860.1 hypothetical protein [Herbaspirillum sp.]
MGTTAVPGTTGDASSTQVAPVFTAAVAAASSPWTDVNLSAATKNDDNSLYVSSGSTLGTESTIVLDGTNHGRIDGGMDGLFFTLQLSDFDRTKHFGVAIRATWSASLTGNWELYLGMSNDEDPVADGGVYLSTQLKSAGPAVGGNDFGQNPTNNQSVSSDVRYLAGMINYRSDRQDGSCGQSANATRASRAGQNRSVDPGTAMTDNDQFILVGIGNQSAKGDGSYNGTLTGLKVQYQLLAHHGQDS